MTDWSLEAADDAARAVQFGGLDPDSRPIVARVGDVVARGAGAWPDGHLGSLTFGPAAVERSLDAALALLARIGVARPIASVPEGSTAGEWLPARGFAPAAALVRLVRVLDQVVAPATTPDLRVEVVGAEAAAQVVAVCRAGFGPGMDPAWWRAGLGRPGWVQVLAYDDAGTPVATGCLAVHDGVGWLGGTTTVPAARGRGAHRALLDLRLALAAEAGAEKVGVLAAEGGASARNLARVGFVAAHRVQQWRRPGP